MVWPSSLSVWQVVELVKGPRWNQLDRFIIHAFQERAEQHWRSKINTWESAVQGSRGSFFLYILRHTIFSSKWCQRFLEPKRKLKIIQTTSLKQQLLHPFVCTTNTWRASSTLCTSQCMGLCSIHVSAFQLECFHSPLENSWSSPSNPF